MSHQDNKSRLEHNRKIARELIKDLEEKRQQEALSLIGRYNLALKPGHIERIKQLADSSKITVQTAAQRIRESIQHDDLDFTLPDIQVPRMKRIVSIFEEISLGKPWESNFTQYLADGNEDDLLHLIENMSWQAFESNKSLRAFLEDLNDIPKFVKNTLR